MYTITSTVEPFDRGLAVHHGNHDCPILCPGLRPHRDHVSVLHMVIDHAIPPDPEQKRTLGRRRSIQGTLSLDVLLREDRSACCHPSCQGDPNRLAPSQGHYPPGAARCLIDVPLFLRGVEKLLHPSSAFPAPKDDRTLTVEGCPFPPTNSWMRQRTSA